MPAGIYVNDDSLICLIVLGFFPFHLITHFTILLVTSSCDPGLQPDNVFTEVQ